MSRLTSICRRRGRCAGPYRRGGARGLVAARSEDDHAHEEPCPEGGTFGGRDPARIDAQHAYPITYREREVNSGRWQIGAFSATCAPGATHALLDPRVSADAVTVSDLPRAPTCACRRQRASGTLAVRKNMRASSIKAFLWLPLSDPQHVVDIFLRPPSRRRQERVVGRRPRIANEINEKCDAACLTPRCRGHISAPPRRGAGGRPKA